MTAAPSKALLLIGPNSKAQRPSASAFSYAKAPHRSVRVSQPHQTSGWSCSFVSIFTLARRNNNFGQSNCVILLTFGHFFEYKDLKLRIPRGLRCSKKGIITMPKRKKTALPRRQSEVLADVKKLLDVQEVLVLGLEKVKIELMSPLNLQDPPPGR